MIPAHHARKIVNILAKIATRPVFEQLKKQVYNAQRRNSHLDDGKSMKASFVADTKTVIHDTVLQDISQSKMGMSQHQDETTHTEDTKKKDVQLVKKFGFNQSGQSMFHMIKQEREDSVNMGAGKYDIMRVG